MDRRLLIIPSFVVTACSATPTQAPPDSGGGGDQLTGGATISGVGGVELTAAAGAFFYIVLANTGFTSSAHYKLQLR